MDLYLQLDRAAGNLAAQIAADLRDAIRSGRLAAGTRMPASRNLAMDLGISRGRVVEAYEQLVAEGFLLARQGAGTQVANLRMPSAPIDPSLPRPQPAPPTPPALDLVPGVPDLASFPRRAWLRALRRVMTTLPSADLGYPDPGGAPVLRAELAGYLRRVRAADVGADDLVVVGGVSQGLSLIVRAVMATGRELLAVEDPTGIRTRPVLAAAGAKQVPIPVDADGIDVAALHRSDARAVLLTPAHQYPTGVVLSPGRRAALLDWAAQADAIVIEDDYDAELRYDRDPVGCIQGLGGGRVVLVGSVSKSLAPGLRLGWVAAPQWLVTAVRQARARSDLGSPVIDQVALAHLIASGDYDRHLRRIRRRYRARRDALVEALTAWLPDGRVHGISGGVHLMVELPAGTDEAAVVAVAARDGLIVEPVASMRARHTGPPALVLGYSRHPEHRLVAAARVLAKAVNANRTR